MPNQFINEAPVLIAGGPGEGFVKTLDAAKNGNPLAILFLAACALYLCYGAWRVIAQLLRTPKTAKWRRWRTIGLISLFCFFLSCVPFWIWNIAPPYLVFVPLAFVFLSAISSDSCRKESAQFNLSHTHETP